MNQAGVMREGEGETERESKRRGKGREIENEIDFILFFQLPFSKLLLSLSFLGFTEMMCGTLVPLQF